MGAETEPVLDDDAVGMEADHLEMLPLAQGLSGPLLPYPGFAAVVHHNVRQGVAAVLAQEARLRTELPALKIEHLRRMPRCSSALGFAARQVNRQVRRPLSAVELREKQLKVAEHRRVMLISAEALAISGHLPQDEVHRIKKGRGFIDQANDCVDLAALFRKHSAAVQGRLPFDFQRVQDAATLGTELANYLRPQGVDDKVPLTREQEEAIRIRDALWTLLVQDYGSSLWRAGAWLFGEQVGEHVPSLLSREPRRAPTAPG